MNSLKLVWKRYYNYIQIGLIISLVILLVIQHVSLTNNDTTITQLRSELINVKNDLIERKAITQQITDSFNSCVNKIK